MAIVDRDGVASYQGYEYQILATVWLTLELMFGRQDCSSVVVEPASGEDVAANLAVPPEAAVSKVTLELAPQSIEVQIKLRQTDQWTLAKLEEVVRGSGEPSKSKAPVTRVRPIDQLLARASARFVLLTNAQVNRELRPFLIERLGEDSTAETIPGKAATGENLQTAKRVGILQQQLPVVLRAHIDTLLQQAGVPYAERQACAAKLQEEVRSRLLRTKPPALTREDLFALLRAFDGLPTTNPGQFFVAPTNFADMERRLENEHRLAINGPPGMGKTLVAEELVRRHRAATDAFKIVRDASPGEIAQCLDQPGRYLFFVEDPWGQFKLSTDADRWAAALPKLLPRANGDKRFLITTRTAIQNTAFANRVPQELVAAQCLLNENHYPMALRREILDRALASVAPWQRDFVHRHRDHILRKLTAPYSLTLLASLLMRAKSEKEIQLEQLLRDCTIEVISSTVAAELRALGRETVASTIAVWAWTMARRKLTPQTADKLRRTIREGGFSGHIDVLKLLTHLNHAHWFREKDGEHSAHPAILEGLELVVTGEPALTDDVLTALFEGLAKQNRGVLAHRIRKSLTGRQLPLPTRVQQAIDSHLLTRLKASLGHGFAEALGEVSTDCRSTEPISLLARALRATPRSDGLLDYEPWQPPTLADVDVERIRECPESRALAGKFVRTILSSEAAQPYNAALLQSFLGQFGWDLSDDYLAAVEEGLRQDNLHCEAAIEATMGVHEPPFDRVIDAALSHYDATSKWWAESQEDYRQARQAEMDADYANYLEEQPQGRFAPSESVLTTAIAVRNQQQGYHWLLQHPRCDDLLGAWAESVTPSTSLPELQALAEACHSSSPETFFIAAEKSKNQDVVGILWKLTLSGTDNSAAGWRALMLLLTAEKLAELVREAAPSVSLVRRLELADAVMVARSFDIDGEEAKKQQVLTALLSPQERKLWETTHPEKIGKSSPPAEAADSLITSLQAIATTSASEELAVRAAFVLAAWGAGTAACVPRLLTSESPEIRLNALRLLSHRDDHDTRARLLAALSDKDYRCRREAMTLLAQSATPTEKQAILDLAHDPSAPVRQRCAESIRHFEWDDAQPILFELLKDRRSKQHGGGLFRGQFPNFHVARAAARALDTFTGDVHISAYQAVKSFLEARQPDRDDPHVHYYALQFLAGIQTQEVIAMLVEYLSDDWHVDGFKHEGFPLRYVAAWGLLTQLLKDKSISDWISMEALYEASRHHDVRLAGSSLVCLGLCGPRASGQIVHLCRAEALSGNRAVLLRLALALADTQAPVELANIVAGHPVESIIQAALADTICNEIDWKRIRDENPRVSAWIDTIQSSEELNPLLRLALYELLDREIEDQLSRADIRANELPESLPTMNLHTMAGGE